MHRILVGVFTLLAFISPVIGQNIDGDWSGKLEIGPGRALKLVLHINLADQTVTLDSPDQGARDINCETVYLDTDSVSMRIPSMLVTYEGRLTDGRLIGVFSQGAFSIQLIFGPGESKANRPQTPRPPYPYQTEDITIPNYEGGSTLSGTLTIPDGASALTPIAVLVSGSGLQNRDEEVFEHKPFAVIADYLARNGIATLRYDDRGCGKSIGDVSEATTADFASDALAAINLLRKQGRFGKIGIIGHSEGGQIAYMLGAKGAVDFLISISGPAVKGINTIAFQNKVALMGSYYSEDQADKFSNALIKMFEYKTENPQTSELSDSVMAQIYPEQSYDMVARLLANQLNSTYTSLDHNKWMLYFLNYDPAEDIRHIQVPAFAVFGGKDLQVPADVNAPLFRQLAPQAVVKIYSELNHLMQHASTGHPDEYGTISETFAEEVLQDITDFIRQ